METELNFKSVIDLLLHFNTEEKCIEYLENLRWKKGVYCPHCFKSNPCKFNDGKTYKCSGKLCRKKFTVKTNSIFSGSNLPLQKWIAAMYLFSSHKKGISSVQMGKDIGVTQKTAWTMLHKIREAFGEPIKEQLSGTIELDETFVGGKNKNRHKDKKVKNSQGRSFKDKTPILGLLCRETKSVYCFVTKDTSQKQIQPLIYQNIEPGSKLMTDEWSAYWGLNATYDHNFVNHGAGQYYSEGDVTTNTLEGFWSHLKRGINGTYHKTSRKYLQKYADEFSFRYNTRFETETERLNHTLNNAYGKSLPYKRLISN
ncbi:MAG TPA: IS1595 family transposase [Fluviicola sp.]|nr:IS1595 family transposase [Fluviicola sp.]